MYEGFIRALEEGNGSSITMDARVYDLLQKQHNKILELEDMLKVYKATTDKYQQCMDMYEKLIEKNKEKETVMKEYIAQLEKYLGINSEVVA
jgi:predicted DNA-binding protein YlxM (UPF0122 family)